MVDATRPAITWPDLFAAVRDSISSVAGQEFDAWVEREGFEVEALVEVARFLRETGEASGEGVPVLLLNAFAMGWDCHREIRGES